MDCFYPIKVALPFPRFIDGKMRSHIVVPCGKCAACISHKVQEWSLRLRQEWKAASSAWFVTLTYRPDCLPFVRADFRHDEDLFKPSRPTQDIAFVKDKDIRLSAEMRRAIDIYDSELVSSSPYVVRRLDHETGEYVYWYASVWLEDYQLYLKSLRKYLAKKTGVKDPLRFYLVSEYGGDTIRPHYHYILFLHPDVSVTEFDVKGYCLNVWKYGDVDTIEPLTNGRVAYCAKYSFKSNTLIRTDMPQMVYSPYKRFIHDGKPICIDNEYWPAMPVFRRMSQGIGKSFLNDIQCKYIQETKKSVVRSDGFQFPLPRYYKTKIFDEKELYLQSTKNLSNKYAKERGDIIKAGSTEEYERITSGQKIAFARIFERKIKKHGI